VTLTRSEQMARIRSRDTKPELALARALRASGIRLTMYASALHGRADFVSRRERVAVFVDGCQWHGCPEHYVKPRSNGEFWARKLEQNFARDHRQTLALEQEGWRVVRVLEHEVWDNVGHAAARVARALTAGRWRRRQELRVRRVDVVDIGSDVERRWVADLRNPDSVHRQVRVRSTKKARPGRVRATR
jgi:DNA mismatch endonuclease, patch repair protein